MSFNYKKTKSYVRVIEQIRKHKLQNDPLDAKNIRRVFFVLNSVSLPVINGLRLLCCDCYDKENVRTVGLTKCKDCMLDEM